MPNHIKKDPAIGGILSFMLCVVLFVQLLDNNAGRVDG